MASEHHSREAPRQAKAPRAVPPAYAPLPDHYAVHGRRPGTPAPEAVAVLEDSAVAVFRGTPDGGTRAGGRIGPVYRSARGRLLVPTGRVLVRFRTGVAAESRRRDIEAAGYAIEEVLPYAAEAAWVHRPGDDVAEALAGLEALRRLAGVDHVEPQLLSRAAQRYLAGGKRKRS
jgi:hypothetical protein